ncbi:uncharacterized protein LOC100843317 [Brachypodium distachyon]|uniref:Uncharacterized protein n=1 Tax=Brachypodium distachyon TaxID=15368 RepID=I1H1J4_BRADI|nr:uncharacterized protein LOC100843317 [Brachypodium distachyon]KQK19843.1 hypothetical protein BRADI_1g50800v3 [Brachypodium distachyon]|eukprot:XP_003561176.1 uncharacterized protein LOC100843317 [Brachypodium distachyon]
MARWSPPPRRDGEHFSLGHDAVSLYFFVACVAATVALTSSMCSACGRKPKAVSQEPDDAAKASVHDETPGGGGDDDAHEDEEVVTLSPELATHGPIQPKPLPVSASRRKLSISMSLSKAQSKAQSIVNIPDKMRLSKRERRDKDAGGGEDGALWKKAIILGEKCRIPGERGDGEASGSSAGDGDPSDSADDEMAAGTFRRSSYSRPVSRSNSFAVQQRTVAEAPAVLQPPPYS